MLALYVWRTRNQRPAPLPSVSLRPQQQPEYNSNNVQFKDEAYSSDNVTFKDDYDSGSLRFKDEMPVEVSSREITASTRAAFRHDHYQPMSRPPKRAISKAGIVVSNPSYGYSQRYDGVQEPAGQGYDQIPAERKNTNKPSF